MASPKAPGGNGGWLTLEQASRLLGIHTTTLRRWANQGSIGVFLTPGGHRRFLRADIERFHQEHHRTRLPALPEPMWVDHAVAHARQSLQEQRWLATYDDAEREAKRQMGRRLMGLVMQYMVRSDESADLLAEARLIGEQHARSGLRLGQPLPELLQVISFFRAALLEVALLEVPHATSAQPEASARLLHRVEKLLLEVQNGVVGLYMSGDRS